MKDKIVWTWKKAIAVILAVLGIGTLTSCYGAPPPDEEEEFYADLMNTQTTELNK